MIKIIKRFIPLVVKDFVKLKLKILALYLIEKDKSKHFYCIICHSHHSGFLPYNILPVYEKGWNRSPIDSELFNIYQYSCPICLNNDRDRLYKYFWLYEFKGKEEGKYNFIDFAPSGLLSQWLKTLPFLNYRSADKFLSNVDDSIDIEYMPNYADNSIDYLLCSHVLEHVNNDKKAVKELFRILKPGGKGLIVAPISLSLTKTLEDDTINTDELRWKLYGQGDHLRLYSKDDYIALLAEAGFVITQYTPRIVLHDVPIQDIYFAGISYSSVIYIVTKHES